MTTHTYDTKCYELAEHFLAEEPNLNDEGYRRALAWAIQSTIEEFMQDALNEQSSHHAEEQGG
jgi:hypothetical protein